MSTKKFLNRCAYWLLFPTLIVGATIAVRHYDYSFLTFSFTIGGILLLFAMVKNPDHIYDHRSDSDMRELRGMLVSISSSAVIWIELLTSSIHTNQWGIIGWIIAGLAFVGLCVKTLKDESFGDVDFWVGALASLITTGSAVGVYLYWGSQYVWIPVVMFLVLCYFLFSAQTGWKEDVDTKDAKPFAIAVAIGVIATISQFWFTPIVYGYTLWQLLIGVGIIAGIAGLVFLSKYMKRRKIQKQKDAENKKLLEAENAKNERIAKERREKLELLAGKIGKDEKPSWADILTLVEAKYKLNKADWYKVIAKADIKELFAVSKIKNQIAWNYGALQTVLKEIEEVCKSCFDDTVIELMIGQIKSLEEYSTYTGYEPLKKYFSDIESIRALVQLKEVQKTIA